jgi:cation diffusion facilitator family transporter
MKGAKPGSDAERREKARVTWVSVVVSLLLASAKLAAGVATGSLGLIAEAAHSALDTVSSVITFISVRLAGRPPDAEHLYGHGRFENLSAVVQGLLLAGTAAWIAYEAVHRISSGGAVVEPTIWAFAVMGASIVLDLWRSRMLLGVARRYHSRALEADALNFRADMLSSAVVIVGLALVASAGAFGGGLLLTADAWAALIVAVFIAVKSGQLALGSVNVLLDRVPAELGRDIADRAGSVSGVVEARSVRVRESGSRRFADVVVSVPRTMSAAEAHVVADRVEEAVRELDPRTESVVHAEPVATDAETLTEAVRAAALRMGVRTHHERVQRSGESFEASLHVEVSPRLALREAHDLARRLSREIREQEPGISRVNTHLEVAEPEPAERPEVTAGYGGLAEEVRRAAEEVGDGARCHEVRLYRAESGGLDAVLHCDFPGDTGMGEVHARTEKIEQSLRQRFPSLEHVVVHAEPREVRGAPRPGEG